MNKDQIDELYHLLRVASNNARLSMVDIDAGLTSAEVTSRIFGLARHLLSTPDYEALVMFSVMYGRKYLSIPTFKAIESIKPTRIVDLGAGLGWLGRDLAGKFEVPYLLVDKRPWIGIDLILDLESDTDLNKLVSVLKDGDLIVMCDFLHCVDKPAAIIDRLNKFYVVILEYSPSNIQYWNSYMTQLKNYGASALGKTAMKVAVKSRLLIEDAIEPYHLYVLGPDESKEIGGKL